MNPNYLTTQDKSQLLPKVKEKYSLFQGSFVHSIFSILLICFFFSLTSVEAAPIITNTATANFTIYGNDLSVTDKVQFTKDTVVAPTDIITLEKSANVSSAVIGDTITYTLSVINPNTRSLSNVVIRDVLPSGFIYVNNSAQLNTLALSSSAVSLVGNILEIELGTIAPNSNVNVTYQTNVSAATPIGIASNRASVSSDTATSSQVQANVDIIIPVIVIPKTPLELIKTANISDAKIGDIVEYSLSIKNNNESSVLGAEIIDNLPQSVEYITNSASLNGNALDESSISLSENNELNFELGTILESSTSTLQYEVKVKSLLNSSRILVNKANLIANDPNANSNTATASVNIVDDSILLTKSTTTTSVNKGEIVDYTIILTNPLTRPLNNIVIKDTLPKGFSYIADSATSNTVSLSPNAVVTNANGIDFKIQSLESESSISVNYQVKVNEDAAPGENINTAQVMSDYASSLAATASVIVRTPSTINFLKINSSGVSSIIQPTSYNTNQEGGKNFEEIDNIPLLDGTTITLPTPQPTVKADQYSAGEPVVIEVIDLDQNVDSQKLETIEVTVRIPGTNDTEILLLTETSPNSGVFRGIVLTSTDNTNKQDGTLTIADGVKINVSYRDDEDNTDSSATAALIVPDTQLQIEKKADKEFSAIGELVRYTLEFRNTTGFNLENLQVLDTLPVGFRYIPNTTELNGNRLINNIFVDGRSLTFKLSNMAAGSSWKIEYVTKISAGAKVGDAINTAYFRSDTLRSNTAQVIVKIKDDLMRSKNILTGRVYIGCRTESDENKEPPEVLGEARIYMETGRSVLTDTEGFWHMEGVYPGAHVLQLDTESIPGYEPLLCDDNTRKAKEARSHFVDLQPGTLWNVDFHVQPIKGYVKQTTKIIKAHKALDPLKLFNENYLDTAKEGFEILWPKNNYVPAVASTKIFIKSSPQHKVELFLNGKKVSPLNYDGSDTNKARTVTVRRWLGVDIDIKIKNNTLLAILKDKSGNEIERKTHNIHFSSKPASAELLEEESVLIADGKTSPVITLKVKDEDGFPMRANTHGYFTIENNKFSVKTQNTDESENRDLNESLSGVYKYDIKEDGIARIELNPTTQSGHVKLNLKFSDSKSISKNSEISVWLKPALRKWIMVGIAEGTLAHNRLSGNMKSLNDLNKTDEFSKRGRIAFFAKGQVKGKYLLTIAYDTHKHDREVGSQLNGNIDPDAFYTIYADNSNSQYDAPSSEKLYLKIEKDSFYALFGDYQTDMSITELAKYQRTLSGIKTEYQGEIFSYNGFISETSNNHHHEEIPGDGTSGLYYLNNKIIPNSETITIETRDRFRSDKIIETRQLSRYQDYNIDYSDGSLFFKFPITSRDSDFNPNIIIVDYDSEEDTNKAITAGGRVAFKTRDGKLETGVSFIHEGQNDTRDNKLVASDLTYKITPDTELRVEVAQSTTEASENQKRAAYLIELEKEIENMEARLFLKKQETGFGIDSQGSEIGTKKIGAELNYRINQDTRVDSEVSVEKNLDNDNKRHLAQVRISKQIKQYEINAGLRHTQEELLGDNNTTEKFENNTLLLGGQYTTDNDRVTLRTDLEKNISSKNGSELSPDRLIVGVDVKVAQGFSIFAEHETTENNKIKTHNNRVGLSKNLWKGAKAKTTYTQERTDEGQRNYATLGLSQNVKLSKKISADFSIDQAKTIGNKQNQKRFNEDEPEIQGAERDDYTAFSVGLGSNDEDWSWTSRAEYRNGDLYDKVNFLASIIRHYDNGKNLSAKLSYYNSEYENGNFDRDIKLSFGSAWHPKEEDFVFLSRLDLVSEKSSDNINDDINAFADSNDNEAQKVIHNMHYNKQMSQKTQLGIHHGIKYVKDENNGVTSSSTIDTATVELRRDINKRWDIGFHTGYLRDWKARAMEYVAGISVGMNPKKNIWVELGYNIEGFTDKDFDNSNYTSEGVYVDFRYKFNQDSFNGDLSDRRKDKKEDTATTKKPIIKTK